MRACAISVNSRSSLCIVNIFYSLSEHRERAYQYCSTQLSLCTVWVVSAACKPFIRRASPFVGIALCWTKNDWIVQLHLFTSNACARRCTCTHKRCLKEHRMHTQGCVFICGQPEMHTWAQRGAWWILYSLQPLMWWTINKTAPCLSRLTLNSQI